MACEVIDLSFFRRSLYVRKLSIIALYGRSIVITLFLSCVINAVILEAFAGEMDVYLKVDDYTWNEYQNGVRLLRESGILLGPGFSYWKEFSNHLTLKPLAELFVGNVGYDGSTQGGIPVKTRVMYVGSNIQCDGGRKFDVGEKSFIEPFVGLGIRFWSRDLHDSTTSSGTFASGYTEEWFTAYTRFGVRGEESVSEVSRLFAEGGVKLPFYNENQVYFNSGNSNPDFTLHPGLQSSWFSEVGMTMYHFKVSVFYDSVRFTQSQNVNTSIGSVYQPISSGDLIGVKLGAAF
jgi:hypothetical protein